MVAADLLAQPEQVPVHSDLAEVHSDRHTDHSDHMVPRVRLSPVEAAEVPGEEAAVVPGAEAAGVVVCSMAA